MKEEQGQVIYFKNLDGIRFLCFLFVFLFHSFYTESPELLANPTYQFWKYDVFGNGNLGVNFFFVLSGFLITYLLIHEKKMNGKIHLRKFWMRRILRIWPLFYFTVFFGFVVFPQLKILTGQVSDEPANLIYYLTFLNNFDFIKHGTDASMLGVLWSVAVEEQFYLVWPLILYFFPIRYYWIPFLVIVSFSLIFRAVFNFYSFHEYHTFSCIGDMTIGALGAWLVCESSIFLNWIKNIRRPFIIFVYILFILICFFRDILLINEIVKVFERSFIATVILFIIIEQNYADNSFYKMKNFKLISRLGTITYGLYCLHFIGILVAIKITSYFLFNTELWQVLIFETMLALILSILIAKISYRFFEKPFLKLKDRFSFDSKSKNNQYNGD